MVHGTDYYREFWINNNEYQRNDTYYKIEKLNIINGQSKIGGFQLEFVSISQVINHMTGYNFECSHWWKIYFKKILYKICPPV